MAIANQLAALFVPEPESERLKAGEERDGFHSLKQRLGLVTLLKMIVRNPRAEVMDVMEANVPGKPLEQLG